MRRVTAGLLSIFLSASLVPDAFSQALRLGSTVGLEVLRGADGVHLEFLVRSPYPNGRVDLLTVSPTGNLFTVARGETGSDGQALFSLRLLGGLPPFSANAIFYGAVAGDAQGQHFLSGPVPLEVGGTWDSDVSSFQPEADFVLPGGPFATGEAFDIDGDGDQDLILGSAEGDALHAFVNDGAGGYTEDTSGRFGAAAVSGVLALAAADVDNDGDIDLFVGTDDGAAEHHLLLNDGAGFFPLDAGLPAKSAGIRTNGAFFFDADGDGDADLYLANGISGAHGVKPVPQENTLLLNDGAGNFTKSARYSEADPVARISRSASAGDVDSDGDLDLVVANAGPNQLFLNDGAGGFDDRSDLLPPAEDSTFAVGIADFDGDGDLDLVYANTVFNPFAQVLLINQGGAQGGPLGLFEVGPFPALAGGQSPVRLGVTSADVDADGDIDIIFAIHELGNLEKPDLYVNLGGRQGGESGTFALDREFPSLPGIYRFLPAVDVDGDADLDLLELNTGTSGEKAPPPAARVLLNRIFEAPDPPLGFQRGDANSDRTADLSDALFILNHLFRGGPAPGCERAADVNASGEVDLSDAIALLNFLFLGGAPPAPPFPGLGDDPSEAGPPCDEVAIFTAAD